MKFNKFDRVQLVSVCDPHTGIEEGESGTIDSVSETDSWDQVSVGWDNGDNSMLSVPPDEIRVVSTLEDMTNCIDNLDDERVSKMRHDYYLAQESLEMLAADLDPGDTDDKDLSEEHLIIIKVLDALSRSRLGEIL